MNKVIAAYIYMRHYQRLQQQEDSSFIRTMIQCYATMTRFYARQFIEHPPAGTTSSQFLTAQDMQQIARLTLTDKHSDSPTKCIPFKVLTSVTDPAATSLYNSIPEMKKLHPGLEKLLVSKPAQRCDKSCGPGDYRPGGKCDINGCYQK